MFKSLDSIFRLIDEKFSNYVEEFQRLIQQPSISAQDVGMEECAEMVREYMVKAGISSAQIISGKGNPIVYGEVKSGSSEKTLLIYSHYDVQPPEPLEEWSVEPFSAEIRDGKIYGRGTSDSKNNVFAMIKAVEAFLEKFSDVPVNLKFVFDGEEEIGSPNLPSFIQSYKGRLKSNGAIMFDGTLDISGRPVITLGVKGIAYLELRVRGAKRDVHSSRAPIIPNPAWRLVWALNTLKDKSEEITIEGFYEKVKEPTEEEIQLMKEIPFSEEKVLKELGLKEFLGGLTGEKLVETLLFKPTCNICGIESGYVGPGAKTILPHEAFAKIDFRLVPDMDPHEVAVKVRNHLRKAGFGDVEVVELPGYPPAKTSIKEAVSQSSVKAASLAWGVEPIIYPIIPASTPMYVFTRDLSVPTAATGCGDSEGNIHAPNEKISLNVLRGGIKYAAALIYAFGEQNSKKSSS